jgi:hypothetical protein
MARWNAYTITPEDDAKIERFYPTLGGEALHRRSLRHLPPRTIRRRAVELGVAYGLLHHRMRLAEVAREAGVTTRTVSVAAHRDGAAIRPRLNARQAPLSYVTVNWARAYIRAARERAEADELSSHWYDVRQAARILGVHRNTILRWTNREPHRTGRYAEAFRHWKATVRTRLTTGRQAGKRIYHPHDVESFRRWYVDRDANRETSRA